MIDARRIEAGMARDLVEALGFEGTRWTPAWQSTSRGTIAGVPVVLGPFFAIGLHHKSYGRAASEDPHNLSSGGRRTHPRNLTSTVTLQFRPALGLGLRVTPRGSPSAERDFSRVFEVSAWGAIPELSSEVRRALVEAHVGEPGVQVTDQGLRLEVSETRHDDGWSRDVVVAAVRHLVEAHAPLAAAAAVLPPPAALGPALAALAEIPLPEGVRRSGGPPGFVGQVRGARVWLSLAMLAPDRLSAHVGVDLPLAVRGAVNPEAARSWIRTLWDLGRNAPDLEFGDPAFDDRFRVTGDASALAAVLDADVRAAMVAVDRIVPARLGPHGVVAAGPVADLSALRDLGYAILALAQFLTD
jgi:hypothetical protein